MGFTLYNEQTGAKHHYDNRKDKRVSFGRDNLEGSLGETIPLELAGNLGYVSKKHIKILKRARGKRINYEVMDLSKNGTCVNGRRIQGGIAELRHGDLIRLGPEDMDNAYAVYFLIDGEAKKNNSRRVDSKGITKDLNATKIIETKEKK